MHVYCKTEKAVLLLAVPDERGVMLFPCDEDPAIPGLLVNVRPMEPVNPQLMESGQTKMNQGAKIDIEQEFSDTIEIDGEVMTVYLGTSSGTLNGFNQTLPDLIRRAPQGRPRVVLMKAMQVFSGALKQQTKAVDFQDAIDHFDK